MLKQLQEKNTKEIIALEDPRFKMYGTIITGLDIEEISNYMNSSTPIPEVNNTYVPSDANMEKMPIYEALQKHVYGGTDIQIGYCNGQNSTLNGVEYHKGVETFIVMDDCMILLGHQWDIENNTYDGSKAEAFFVKKGTAFEIYPTTLHLSPARVSESGFRCVIVLPRGTNTALDYDITVVTKEDEIHLMKNKWIIAHKDREPLVKAGAHVGVLGENYDLKF